MPGGFKSVELPKNPPIVLPQKFIIKKRLKEVENLRFRQTDFQAKITVLETESLELAQQKEAIKDAIEELRQGLKFESTISAKVFFGKDAAKDSDESLVLQIRMLEDELHRKKIQWSKLQHTNFKTADDVSESRLRKTKCIKVSKFLEEEFKEEQVRMEDVLTKSNLYAREITTLDQKHEEMLNRIEERSSSQSEKQKKLLQKLTGLREKIDLWKQEDNIKAINEQVKSTIRRLPGVSSDVTVASDVQGSDLAHQEEEAQEEREVQVLEKYASFTKAFKTLMRETGEADIRKIVDIFMQREEENYALYNHLQRMEHSIQTEEHKLAKVTQEMQQYTSKAEGAVQQGSSTFRRKAQERDDLIKEFKESSKERKAMQRTQRRWHSQIEQFLCLLFGSDFEYQSQLLHNSSGVSEMILDIKNLLRTKTMFGSPAAQKTGQVKGAAAILISEANAMLGFAIIEQTVAEIMPALIDAMQSSSLNDVIRSASMNKYGTLAPPVSRRSTMLESKATKLYDVIAPELSDVNPEGDNAHGHGSMSNEDIARKKDRLDISYGPSSTVPFNSQTMREQLEKEIQRTLIPRRSGFKKSSTQHNIPAISLNQSVSASAELSVTQ